MEVVELIKQSKAVADLVWNAVKVSNPALECMCVT